MVAAAVRWGGPFVRVVVFVVHFVGEFRHVRHGTNSLIAFRLIVSPILKGLVK